MKKIILVCLTIIGLISLYGCINRYTYVEGKVNIVATTTMLGDLARNVGKDKVNVVTLMNQAVDPHSYIPKPSDTQALKKCDVVITNGLHLEAQMGEVIEKLGSKVFMAGSVLNNDMVLVDESGAYDPHIWFDVSLWKEVAIGFGEYLVEFDKENSSIYQEYIEDYCAELDDLEEYIFNKSNELMSNQRILVTAHDAFNYFANRYNFEVYAIQGISTQAEASAKDIQNLANLVSDLNVKAIFIESSVSETTVKSVINAANRKGHNLKIGGELYSDSLKYNTSYIKTIIHNIDTIVGALK